MGISPIDSNCSKHPNLKQIPGVCSSCLREKLSKLTSSTHTTFTDFSSAAIFHSSSPEFSSTPPPLPPPPPQGGGGHRRIGSATATMTKNGIGLLKKSRSVTCGGRMKRRGDEEEEEEEDEGEMIELDLSGSKKKKSGFWWRLIRSTGKKMSGIKQR